MGIKFQGPVCSICNTIIEGTNFYICNQCHATIHQNPHCRTIHQNSCMKIGPKNPISSGFERNPDIHDIFKY